MRVIGLKGDVAKICNVEGPMLVTFKYIVDIVILNRIRTTTSKYETWLEVLGLIYASFFFPLIVESITDKIWIYKQNRCGAKYIGDIRVFIILAKNCVDSRGMIRCPYWK